MVLPFKSCVLFIVAHSTSDPLVECCFIVVLPTCFPFFPEKAERRLCGIRTKRRTAAVATAGASPLAGVTVIVLSATTVVVPTAIVAAAFVAAVTDATAAAAASDDATGAAAAFTPYRPGAGLSQHGTGGWTPTAGTDEGRDRALSWRAYGV